jgi:glycosyltransferase involved in cell wall biosynthesis
MNRLVQVQPHYSPPYVGGMEMRARERAEALASQGWVVETLTSSAKTYPHAVTSGNLIVRYLRSRDVAHTPIIFSLPAVLMRVPRDSVVHLESALAYSPEVTALVCRLRGIPYVLRVALDTAGHTSLRNALLRSYQRVILKQVYRHAALVIVLTADDVPLVTEKYRVHPSQVRVIPDATNFAPANSARTRPHDPFRLLFVGRVDMQKNVPLLLRSLRYFLDSYSLPAHLDLVGDGEDMPAVRKLVSELSLRDYVSLRGFVTGDKLEELYEASDALVLTSTHETFGQVTLEAMTKGTPVIASNIRCVRQVVPDGTAGLLVDQDERSFAAAMHRLVTEEGLYEKLSLGALENSKHYSMAATVNAYAAAYDEASHRTSASRSGRPPSPR